MPDNPVYTIAPHAPFLPTLADRILDGTLLSGWEPSGPFGLADVTIILPTRRARLALAAIFADRAHGTALLPDIRTFGADPAEEEPFLPPFDEPPSVPVIPASARTLILAHLVEKWLRTRQPAAPSSGPGISGSGTADETGTAQPFALARSLGELIDDCIIENTAFSAIRAIPPEELNAFWQENLRFLDIALKAWPDLLAEFGAIDAAEARNRALLKRAGLAQDIYGGKPVIAAGSTGSIPATAALLAAISKLPRGAIVLPGFDTTLDPETRAGLLDPATNPHGHPQYGLVNLLGRIAPRRGVEELVVERDPRTEIVRHALAPVAATANWSRVQIALQPRFQAALQNLALMIAPRQDMEARAIAIAARNALEDQRTVGIVSPDRTLARRIASELRRFGIHADDSAGTPLFQTAAGRLARQLIALVEGDWNPVDLITLLRNRFVHLGQAASTFANLADVLEGAILRGNRPPSGHDGLIAALKENLAGNAPYAPVQLTGDTCKSACDGLDALHAAIAPLTGFRNARRRTAAGLAEALMAAIAALLKPQPATRPVDLPGLAELSRWGALIRSHPDPGPDLSGNGLEQILSVLWTGISVRPASGTRSDIYIWGQLEARLLSPDLLILSGLNETIWPPVADPGPWLSRNMKIAAGLEPPERQHGQAAHDLQMALGNAHVLMTCSERIGTSPAEPSRLLQRLTAFIGSDVSDRMRARGALFLDAARRIDFTGEPVPVLRPAPAPAKNARPRRLSVTDVETLIRSPYDIYAKYTLNLRQLPPLGADFDSADRGNLIHNILAAFIEAHDPLSAGAAAELAEIADRHFDALEIDPELRTLWRRRFNNAARQYLEFEHARPVPVAAYHAEKTARAEFTVSGETITLTGRADRIDQLQDGTFHILDFKTGSVPGKPDMKAMVSPQLLAEALLLEMGGFADIGAGTASLLTYVKIAAGPDAIRIEDYALPEGMDLPQTLQAFHRNLVGHFDRFLLSGTTPMPAHILPRRNQRFAGTYDHLARMAEWTVSDGEEQ